MVAWVSAAQEMPYMGEDVIKTAQTNNKYLFCMFQLVCNMPYSHGDTITLFCFETFHTNPFYTIFPFVFRTLSYYYMGPRFRFM